MTAGNTSGNQIILIFLEGRYLSLGVSEILNKSLKLESSGIKCLSLFLIIERDNFSTFIFVTVEK